MLTAEEEDTIYTLLHPIDVEPLGKVYAFLVGALGGLIGLAIAVLWLVAFR